MALEVEQQKAAAARQAAGLVLDGQILGLGSGTTAAYLLQALGERVRGGLRVVGVPTSEDSARLAKSLGIALTTLEAHPHLDLDLDGADEVDPDLNLIKGRGGALLREKIVASAARQLAIIVDETKLVRHLGERAPIPVEVIPFGWSVTLAALTELGATAEIRGGDQPFHTDNGNLILDCRFADLSNPRRVAASVKALPGVVDHGLFLGMASIAIVGHADGSVTRMER